MRFPVPPPSLDLGAPEHVCGPGKVLQSLPAARVHFPAIFCITTTSVTLLSWRCQRHHGPASFAITTRRRQFFLTRPVPFFLVAPSLRCAAWLWSCRVQTIVSSSRRLWTGADPSHTRARPGSFFLPKANVHSSHKTPPTSLPVGNPNRHRRGRSFRRET